MVVVTYFGNMKTPTRKIATRMIPTGQLAPRKLPPKKIFTQNKSQPDNSHPGKLPPGKFPPGQILPRKTPIQKIHPEIATLKIPTQIIPPHRRFPTGKIFIQPIATPDNFHSANLVK